jgi:hypothetical protein
MDSLRGRLGQRDSFSFHSQTTYFVRFEAEAVARHTCSTLTTRGGAASLLATFEVVETCIAAQLIIGILSSDAA